MRAAPRRPLLLAVLLLALFGLQGRLWFGEGSLRHGHALEQQAAGMDERNTGLRERNALLEADVNDLKDGLDTLEEIARKDLGMIRDGETFFIFAPSSTSSSAPSTEAPHAATR